MNTKNKMLSMALALVMPLAAVAGPYDRTDTFDMDARVVSVERVVDYQRTNVSQRNQNCYRIQSRSGYNRNHNSHGNAVLGGIVGGVIGNQFGDGDGRTAMTIAGTVAGASYGNRRDHNNDGWNNGRYMADGGNYRTECYRTRAGWGPNRAQYVVSYLLGNQEFRTVTDHNPGNHLRVRVNITTLE